MSKTKITTPIQKIKADVYGLICQELNSRVQKSLPKITNELRSFIQASIYNDATTRELLNPTSKLHGFLGVTDMASAVDDVVKAVVDSIEIRVEPFRYVAGHIRGRITFGIIESSLKSVRALPSAQVISKKGGHNWITTLCINGDRTYGFESSFLFKPDDKPFSQSRTDHSLVVPHSGARLLRVDPQWSGVKDNNWLTRAIDSDDFADLFRRLMITHLG